MSQAKPKRNLTLKIFHVDDDKADRDAVRALLQSFHGVEVVECDVPGHIHQSRIKECHISIVDLEYNKKMRDQEVIGLIRDLSPHSEIIVLSNYGKGDAKENPYDAWDVISKFSFHHNPQLLLSSIMHLLSGSHPPSTPSGSSPNPSLLQEFQAVLTTWKDTEGFTARRLGFVLINLFASTPGIRCFLLLGIASIVAMGLCIVLIPISLLLVCAIISCLCIGFQCASHVVYAVRSNVTTRILSGEFSIKGKRSRI